VRVEQLEEAVKGGRVHWLESFIYIFYSFFNYSLNNIIIIIISYINRWAPASRVGCILRPSHLLPGGGWRAARASVWTELRDEPVCLTLRLAGGFERGGEG
jgi:hypothetical protein